MEAFVNPICGLAKGLWDPISNHFSYFWDLKENLQSLEDKMQQLKHASEDVKSRVEFEEEQQMKRTKKVESWLIQVQGLEEKVNQILEEGKNPAKCCGISWFPKNCCSSYKLGKKACQLLKDVIELTSEGSFDVVALRLPLAPVDERPMEDTVGFDSKLEEVSRYVQDEYVGIIGLYGMPGVGKTTLLKKINNTGVSLLSPTTSTEKGFDVVIWAVVSNSKEAASIEKVQEAIRNKFQIPDEIWKDRSRDGKVAEIFRVLRRKRFLLLLDDLWERFDLSKAGIPSPDPKNGSKVIFTTQSEDVCGRMQAHKKIKIECLSPKEALELFRRNVGDDTLNSHPRIPDYAEIIAKKCHGLPLALVTAGRAMASRKNHRDWKHAVGTLDRALPKLSGMVDDVFPVLKLSYDSLQNDTLKSCFLYCSIFLENYNIRVDDLIDLWIGEGFMGELSKIDDARNHGHHLIESLKLASLLQIDELEMCVTMHDLIREMALWIACDNGKTNKFLVQEGEASIRALGSAEWSGSVERMSLWGQSIEDVSEIKFCPNLLTLIVRDVISHGVPLRFDSDFFRSIQSLKVLDLSYNSSLEFLDGIGELINLQYLNLSGTAIRELPVELKKLKKLRCLLLNDMINLKRIAGEVMSSLSLLRLFSKLESPFHLDRYEELYYDEIALLEDLDRLKNVSDICLTLCNEPSVKQLLDSPKLSGCTRGLSLVGCFGMTSIRGSTSSLQHLESLSLHYCKSMVQAFVLEYNSFTYKTKFRNDYFHNLCDLCIHQCPSMRDVVGDDLGDGELEERPTIFSSLKRLRLYNLPMLTSIYPRVLPFPSLIRIEVYGCPSLKQLPFDSSSAKNSLKEITGEKSWWDGLQWQDEDTMRVFSSKFHPEVDLN